MQGVPVYVSTMSQDGEWKKKFPRGIAAFIGVVQMFLTLGILTCETISMLNGFKHGFLFIGYGTSFFFTITWITVYGSRKSRYCSMSDFLYVCCSGRCCTTYTLIMEILCFCFSIILLAFDIIFLQNPYKCFFTDPIDNCDLFSDYNYDSLWSFDGTYLSISKNKVPAIKGQLAGAVLMLVTATLYIVMYIVTAVKIHRSHYSNRPSASMQFQRIPTTIGYRQQQSPPQIQNQYDHPTPVFTLQQQQQVPNLQRQKQQLQQHLAMEEQIECYNCHRMVTIPSTIITRV